MNEVNFPLDKLTEIPFNQCVEQYILIILSIQAKIVKIYLRATIGN
jgi:hypothetical protein